MITLWVVLAVLGLLSMIFGIVALSVTRLRRIAIVLPTMGGGAVFLVVGIFGIVTNCYPTPTDSIVFKALESDAERAKKAVENVHSRAESLHKGSGAILNDISTWYRPVGSCSGDLERRVMALQGRVDSLARNIDAVKDNDKKVNDAIRELAEAIRDSDRDHTQPHHSPPRR